MLGYFFRRIIRLQTPLRLGARAGCRCCYMAQVYHWVMQRLQGFKYALMPNGEQARNMRRFAGSCRFVFNKALALQKENHGWRTPI